MIGAAIVFLCALTGSRILEKWTNVDSEPNTYLYALGLILLVAMLANTADFLRPVEGSLSFRSSGWPFAFYREGGYIGDFVWQPEKFLWREFVANVAIMGAAVLLIGRGWQVFRSRD